MSLPIDTSNKCSLKDDYETFFKGKLLYDIQFIVGTEEIKIMAHIAFVAARSEYLRTKILEARNVKQQLPPILDDNEKETLLEVRLPNANPEAFEIILKYIYTDRIDLKEPYDQNIIFITDIYQLAGLFLMPSLKDRFIEIIKTKINKLNILEALNYAVEKKIQNVKDICMHTLNEDQKILNVVVMSDEFRDLDKPLLVEIMRNKLKPSNIESDTNIDDEADSEMDKSMYFSGTMENDMQSFFESSGEDFGDIDLVLDGHTIKAHKCILYARTRYFQGMFRHFMPPDNKVNISIGDRLPSVEAFQSLLRYIYYGELKLSPMDAIYLLQASNVYGFSNNHFYSFCKNTLNDDNLSIDNVLEILAVSDYARNFDIKKRALMIIANDVARIARLPKFSSLSRELLLDIINVAHGIS